MIRSATVRLLDLPSGREEELGSYPGKEPGKFPAGNLSGVRAIAFSPGGHWLAAVVPVGPEPDGPWCLRLWESGTRQERLRFDGLLQNAEALAFSPDGRALAALDWDGTVRLWETASGKERRRFRYPKANAGSALLFSPDGKTLVSGIGKAFLWDVTALSPGMKPPRSDSLNRLWDDLAAEDAETAYRATCGLVAVPESSLPLLAERLRAQMVPDGARLTRLIADLGAQRFAAREQATRELERLGELAWPALRQALQANPGAEARRRIEALLADSAVTVRSPEARRVVRAVEALEHIGTPAARKVLEGLTKDLPQTWAAQQARPALDRLSK
jgi:hypothetical protein